MIIVGSIEEIIFRNETNGYTVAMMEHGDEYSAVVGKFLQVAVGQTFRLEGRFVTNSRYGEQFAFDSYEQVYPTTKSGIKKYLGSGLIKGVGPVTAKAIVDRFGDKTLEVIEFTPEKLVEIRGISKNKAEQIGSAFRELKAVQNAVLFLQEYNISINLALKIYEQYGAKTVETVKENPYKLVEDIDGVGFLTADNIAGSMGVGRNSPFRVRAGLLHVLGEAEVKNGHTFLPREKLFEDAQKLLNFYDETLFESVLSELALEKVVTTFKSYPYDVVMLTKTYYLENSIAQKLAYLICSSKEESLDISREIEAFESKNNIKLHKTQKEAVERAINSGVSVITGGPGTGKTTIVKCIIEILEALGKKVALMAPTGRASKRLSESTGREAKTIHRALGIDFSSKKFVHNEKHPLEYSAVIVDEVSMVDVSLMSSLLKALARDCKLILVGDKDQLPSVGAGNVLEDILKSGLVSVTQLSHIYRQDSNSLIITNAHAINCGEMPVLDNKSSDFFFESKTTPAEIKSSIVEMVTRRLKDFLKLDPSKIQVLAPMKNGEAGVESLNRSLQARLNPPSLGKAEIVVGQTIFRQGDKVMQTSNNYDLTWKRKSNFMLEEGAGVFNGDIGYIDAINRETGEVLVLFEDGRECFYPRTELSQLSLAYAITIHKSQGSEFDAVIIPAIAGPSLILNRNLLYTAVTRAKRAVVIVGERKNLRRMISNKYTLKRYTMLTPLLKEAYKKVAMLFGE